MGELGSRKGKATNEATFGCFIFALTLFAMGPISIFRLGAEFPKVAEVAFVVGTVVTLAAFLVAVIMSLVVYRRRRKEEWERLR